MASGRIQGRNALVKLYHGDTAEAYCFTYLLYLWRAYMALGIVEVAAGGQTGELGENQKVLAGKKAFLSEGGRTRR